MRFFTYLVLMTFCLNSHGGTSVNSEKKEIVNQLNFEFKKLKDISLRIGSKVQKYSESKGIYDSGLQFVDLNLLGNNCTLSHQNNNIGGSYKQTAGIYPLSDVSFEFYEYPVDKSSIHNDWWYHYLIESKCKNGSVCIEIKPAFSYGNGTKDRNMGFYGEGSKESVMRVVELLNTLSQMCIGSTTLVKKSLTDDDKSPIPATTSTAPTNRSNNSDYIIFSGNPVYSNDGSTTWHGKCKADNAGAWVTKRNGSDVVGWSHEKRSGGAESNISIDAAFRKACGNS